MEITLYELRTSYLQLERLLDEDPNADIEAALSMVDDSFEEKVENVIKIIRMYESYQEAIKVEEQRMKKRREDYQKKCERLTAYIESNMRAIGKEKVEGVLFTARIQKNPPKVVVRNLDHIPFHFFKHPKPTLDKEAVKKAIQTGVDVPGASLEQEERLQIK